MVSGVVEWSRLGNPVLDPVRERVLAPVDRREVRVLEEDVDEAALVAAAQQDPAAFGPLYQAYLERIYRYVYRRVGSHALAEDLTAQTFQQALAALPAYEWRGVPFGAWLYRIAANLIIKQGRASARECTVEDIGERVSLAAGVGEDPAAILERDADAAAVRAVVARLPLDQQRAIVLKFSHGLTAREIGEAMGRSEGAVKQLVHRAMLSLRANLVDVV